MITRLTEYEARLVRANYLENAVPKIIENFCSCGRCQVDALKCLEYNRVQIHPHNKKSFEVLQRKYGESLATIGDLNQRIEQSSTGTLAEFEQQIINIIRDQSMEEINTLKRKVESLGKGLADECEYRKALELKIVEYEEILTKVNSDNDRLHHENIRLRAERAAHNKNNSSRNNDLLQKIGKLVDDMKQQVLQFQSLETEDTEAIKEFEVL
jgi:hypothetical protein